MSEPGSYPTQDIIGCRLQLAGDPRCAFGCLVHNQTPVDHENYPQWSLAFRASICLQGEVKYSYINGRCFSRPCGDIQSIRPTARYDLLRKTALPGEGLHSMDGAEKRAEVLCRQRGIHKGSSSSGRHIPKP